MASADSFTREGQGRDAVNMSTRGCVETICIVENGVRRGVLDLLDKVETNAIGRGTKPPMRILYIELRKDENKDEEEKMKLRGICGVWVPFLEG